MADTYDLALVQGQRLRRGFRLKVEDVAQVLTDYSYAGQVRQKEAPDGDLILDLTPYLALDLQDSTLLMLDVPAIVTAKLPKARTSAAWDLFVWPTAAPANALLLVQGAASVDRSATNMETALA